MLLLLTSSCLTICPCSVHSYSLLLYLGAALPWMRWTYVCIPRCSTWHAPPHPCFTLDALAICIPFCTQPGMLYPIRAPPGLPLCSMLNLACSTPSIHYLGYHCVACSTWHAPPHPYTTWAAAALRASLRLSTSIRPSGKTTSRQRENMAWFTLWSQQVSPEAEHSVNLGSFTQVTQTTNADVVSLLRRRVLGLQCLLARLSIDLGAWSILERSWKGAFKMMKMTKCGWI